MIYILNKTPSSRIFKPSLEKWRWRLKFSNLLISSTLKLIVPKLESYSNS